MPYKGPSSDPTPKRRGSGGSFAVPNRRGTPAPRPTPSVTPGPVPVQRSASVGGGGGGGGGGFVDSYSGGGGGGGSFAPMAAPAPPPPPSEEDYLAGDASYNVQIAALLRALKDYETDDTAQRSKYEVDYKDATKGLGWTADDPATKDVNEGAFNREDMNTASGRAFQNQQNDFASRGMLQSSLYGTANDDLMRSFTDQLAGIDRGRTDFLGDRDRQLSGFRNENKTGQQTSRAESLARRAATYGL